jgi:hypothetical protein
MHDVPASSISTPPRDSETTRLGAIGREMLTTIEPSVRLIVAVAPGWAQPRSGTVIEIDVGVDAVTDAGRPPTLTTGTPPGEFSTESVTAAPERSVSVEIPRIRNGPVTTVITAEPVIPSDVAVITPLPPATAATTPAAVTVAVLMLLDAHVTVRPASTLPDASVATADNCVVAPADVSVTVGGVTTIVATGGGLGAGVSVAGASGPPPQAAAATSARSYSSRRGTILLGRGIWTLSESHAGPIAQSYCRSGGGAEGKTRASSETLVIGEAVGRV